MTPEERNVLLPLLDKLKETDVSEKDAEADQLIHQTLAAKPDAAYILAQTVLMQDFALHQAQDTIQKLKAQSASQPSSSGSGGFLGSLFGGHSSPAPAQPQTQYQQPQYSQPQASPWGQRPMQSSPYAQPMMAAVQPGNGTQPSFLRGAAQTAAGIAGGALLFDGISSLFGGHGGGMGGFGGGMGGGFGGSGFGQPAENVDNHEVVNNYYDQPAPDGDMGAQGGDSNDYIDNSGGIDTSTGDDSDFGL